MAKAVGQQFGGAAVTNIAIVRQGESLPFQFDRADESIQGWVCLIEVKKLTSDAALISRTITPTGTVWLGFLTSTETTPLAIGLYRLLGALTNASTDEEEQVLLRFNITDSWAT